MGTYAEQLRVRLRGFARVQVFGEVWNLGASRATRRLLEATAERLPLFDRPALVVWAREDRVMPPEHGRRLAALLPQGRLVEVDDGYTLLPLDRPAELARIIREFVRATQVH